MVGEGSISASVTVSAMKALAARGLRCPQDVSIVGIDDFTWAEAVLPRLTVVAQPIALMGRTAVDLLLNRNPSRPRREPISLQPRLIARDSTRAVTPG